MGNLLARAFGGLIFLLVVIGACLFAPAGTIRYWQAWVFLAVFGTSVLAITAYLTVYDRALLERRTKAGPVAEATRTQKVIQSFASLAFLATLIVPALDHRFAWSNVPAIGAAVGDIFVALGLFAVFAVFRANTFTSATIEVDARQKVISTGPYAWVRHPMYAGALVMLLAMPIALGSWWGLFTFVPMAAVIAWRLLEEEKFLATNLEGYAQYADKVRFRLVPYVW